MSISARIEETIESWSQKWQDRLKGYLTEIIGFGIEVLFDIIGKKAAPQLKPFIDRLQETGKLPPEFALIFEELTNPTGEWAALLGQSAGGAAVGGAIGRIIDPLLNPVAYAINQQTKTVRLAMSELVTAWRRGAITTDDLRVYLEQYGLAPEFSEALKTITEARLDPATVTRAWLLDKDGNAGLWDDLRESGVTEDRIDVIKALGRQLVDPQTVTRAWLRDKAKYAGLWDDVAGQGFSEEAIEAFKELSNFIPSPSDLVMFAGREAFEEDAVEKYGLDNEFEKLDLDTFAKVGVTPEIAKLYWRVHWEHPSFGQVREMRRRELITDEDVTNYYRIVETPTYWRPFLDKLIWETPTRVDIRRFWDMRTIDEPRLREYYGRLGYHGQELDDYVLWTKIYTDFPLQFNRFENGWITQSELYQWLTDKGMPEERANQFMEEKIKNVATVTMTKNKDLTEATILKGYKQEQLTRGATLEMLEGLGYSQAEADLVIQIKVEAAASPETEADYFEIVQAFRRANGQKAATLSPELRELSRRLFDLEAEERKAIAKPATDKQIAKIGARVLIARAEYNEAKARLKFE